MKNHVLWSVCLLVSAALLSCQKEQILVNKIEGNYKIEKLVYNTVLGDSVVNYANSTMFFDDCTLKDQKGAQQCAGYIAFEGRDRITFGYRPEKSSSKIQMFFNIPATDDFINYGGAYEVEERTDNTMIIFRYGYDEYRDKVVDFRMYLKK